MTSIIFIKPLYKMHTLVYNDIRRNIIERFERENAVCKTVCYRELRYANTHTVEAHNSHKRKCAREQMLTTSVLSAILDNFEL